MQQAALRWQRWLGRELSHPSEGTSPPLTGPNPSIHQLQRMQIHFSAVLLETKFCPVTSVIGFPDDRLPPGVSCSQCWYFTSRRMENTLAEGLFWPHKTGPVAFCIQQKIVVPTMENGRGGRDELGARSAPKPKHALQRFLLQWDTQVKPSQRSASLKTHSPASTSPRRILTEQRHVTLAKQPVEGKLEVF